MPRRDRNPHPNHYGPIGIIVLAVLGFLAVAPWVVVDAMVWRAVLEGPENTGLSE